MAFFLMGGNIVSLRGREREPDVAQLLAIAQIHREASDAATRGPLIAVDYANAEHLHLYGYEEDNRIVGLIGIEPQDEGNAIIRDLAVAPDARRRGIGRALIEYLRNDLHLERLEGDTLAQATTFYECCGFTLSANSTMPDGATRYRFAWPSEPHP